MKEKRVKTTIILLQSTAVVGLILVLMVYNINFDTRTQKNCIKTNSLFTVCPFQQSRNKGGIVRDMSYHLHHYGAWKEDIILQIQFLLKKNPGLDFIDIGAGIGYFSLAAAAIGSKVLAVEPATENLQQFAAAAKLNGVLDNITFVQKAVSDSTGYGTLKSNVDQQGDYRLSAPNITCVSLLCHQYTQDSEEVKTIAIDDLVSDCKFNRAIMKVHTNGLENRIFISSNKLFKTVNIYAIFMDISFFTFPNMKSEFIPSKEQLLFEQTIEFLFNRKYRPYISIRSWQELDPKKWNSWPENIVWLQRHHKA